MTASQTPQVVALAVYDGVSPAVASSQVLALGVYEGDAALEAGSYTWTPQFLALAVIETDPVLGQGLLASTSQFLALAVYGEGATERFGLKGWGFVLDGHHMYVLHLGMLGTYVYDLSTTTWAQWQTEGYERWNAEQGTMWNGMIIAGDSQDGTLWIVDPDVQDDAGFRPIRHLVTGIIPARARETLSLDALRVTASVGYPVGDEPIVGIRFSDDYGRTWVDMTDSDVTLLNDDFTQEIAFRSQGSFGAPGRVIEVSDFGGPVRIDDADVEVSGGDS